jgi:membrane-associated phospholipid phosphatase
MGLQKAKFENRLTGIKIPGISGRNSLKTAGITLIIGLTFCPQYTFSQQDTSSSPIYLADSLSFVQFEYDSLQAAFDTLTDEPEWFLSSMVKDHAKLWSSPCRIEKEDLKLLIPVIAATAITIVYDEEIYSSVKKYQNAHPWVSEISPVITKGGEAFVLEVGGLFILSGVIFRNEKARQTGYIALQTWVHAGIIVQVSKLIFGRQRPSFENGVDKWHGFPESLNRFTGGNVSKYDAFPSGHTIEAFGLATVIAEQYKDIKIIPIISYTLATGVGLSRITEDTHWLSDVILGAAMGYGIGKFMVRERKDTKWTIIPKTSKNKMELTAIYLF